MSIYKHKILVEVVIDDDMIKGVCVQPIIKKGEDPYKKLTKKQVLETYLTLLASGIISIIHYGHQKGTKDSAESMREVIEELEKGFIHTGADASNRKEYKEITKIDE